ncbi:MAG: protein kinase [Gammaproteobacteria bacterium]|nr:protein kinase [Gammaproteobacteria bacterium]MBU1655976.1 protein kinase [Gammaproteobacteria bacterium]MBU1962560.1 protein kinase [Gammaproteobacteria bacterium]
MNSYSQTLPLNELIGGRYRIQSVLGEGGFGITYRAWDEKLRRRVVVKEYLPGEVGARDRDTLRVLPRTQREESFRYGLERYLEEAVTLARFKHPNIVQIHDFFEANGTAYILMDFEEGETLSERLKSRGGHLSEAEILDLLVPLLQGLRQVHEAGLLHRDIKPGNIFLRREGGPLLIDFGSARQALGERSKTLSAIVSQGYAPPEQYSTRSKQGPYSDLYAIGAMLYELIIGEPPIESVDRSHEIMSGSADPLVPAVRAGRGKASDWLLQLIDQLLAIPSKDRPQGCDEVLGFIQSHGVAGALTGDPPRSSKTRVVSERERFDALPPARGGRRSWAMAAFLLMIPVVGALAYLGWQGQRSGGEGDAAIPPPVIAAGPKAAAGVQPPVVTPPVAVPAPALKPTKPEPAPKPVAATPEPPPPATGQIQVSVNLPNARVRLDGATAGKAGPGAPFRREGLSLGDHRIEVTAEGFPPWQGHVGVRAGEWTRVAVEFNAEERLDSPAPPSAHKPAIAPPPADPLYARCERYATEDEIPPQERGQYIRQCMATMNGRREGLGRANPRKDRIQARCERYASDDGIPPEERERYVQDCVASLRGR